MAPRIKWDESGERLFEAGIDRCVLYVIDDNSLSQFPTSTAIPWSGVTGIEETSDAGELKKYYLDGRSYYIKKQPKEFKAKLTAFTYPDEFAQFEGYKEVGVGMMMDEQPVTKLFHMSYRTLIGNDTSGTGYAYKLHLLYNLTATPSQLKTSSLSKSVDPADFAWDIQGLPQEYLGFPSSVPAPTNLRPTSHIVLDSRKIPAAVMATIEKRLYGESLGGMPTPYYILSSLFYVWETDDGIVHVLGDPPIVSVKANPTGSPYPFNYVIDSPGVVPTEDKWTFELTNDPS